MNEPIADGIGDGGVSDQLVPVVHRQLAGDQGGTQAVAVFEDLQQIVLLLGGCTDNSLDGTLTRKMNSCYCERTGMNPFF